MANHQDGGRIAGRYEVVGPPMQGGMGLVYVCRDLTDDRPVALKTFKSQYLRDRAARDRFLREGTAWVELGYHPHIVRCYRVEYIDPQAYLVLELIAKEPGRAGASLREWLTPGRGLGVETALLYALQIARGMKHASQKIAGFVHRDLKPENVLVGADKLPGTQINRLRVTDFGLVRALAGAGEETLEGDDLAAMGRTHLTRGMMGTPLYMAPEQWRGEEVSVATDVYALGCILYEMLCGERVVKGKTMAELRAGHCAEKTELKLEGYPVEVRNLPKRCLALAPGQRFGDWLSLERALEQVYAQISGSQTPPEEAQAGPGSREDRVAEGGAYNAMGMSYRDLGKARVAIGYYQRAAEVGRVEGERVLEGAALCNLGLAYAALGEVQRAIGYYEQALIILREIGDRRGEGNALGSLGLAYADLGEVQRAIGYYEQWLIIAREIGDPRGEGNALGSLGLAYADLGEVQRAIGYYEQWLIFARKIGDRRGEGAALGNLGLAYADLGEVQHAIGYYEQALVILREIGDRRGEGNALGNLGNAYKNLGEVQRSIGYYEQGLMIDREIGDRLGEGTDLGNLGTAYARLGEVQRAIRYYEQQLSIVREIGYRRGEGIALGNLGGAYHRLGEVQRAIEYYEQGLVINREIGDRRGEGTVLGNLGIAYKNLGEVQRAIGYYEQRLIIAREIGDINGVATTSFNMANLYRQEGELVKALPLAQSAAEIWLRMGHAEYARDAQGLVEKAAETALIAGK